MDVSELFRRTSELGLKLTVDYDSCSNIRVTFSGEAGAEKIESRITISQEHIQNIGWEIVDRDIERLLREAKVMIDDAGFRLVSNMPEEAIPSVAHGGPIDGRLQVLRSGKSFNSGSFAVGKDVKISKYRIRMIDSRYAVDSDGNYIYDYCG